MPKRSCPRPIAPAGTRVCRVCQSALSLDEFMPGCVRYICRKHYYEQQHRFLAASKNMAVYTAKKDCLEHFAGCCPSFDCGVARSVIPPHIAGHVYLLPRDPALPLSADNVYSCDAKHRRVALDLWRLQPNRALYMQLADSMKHDSSSIV
jgi:hypothetical protein